MTDSGCPSSPSAQHPCLGPPAFPMGHNEPLGLRLEGSAAPCGTAESPIRAEAGAPQAQSCASAPRLQLPLGEGHFLTVVALKWVQFSEWFL